MQIRSSWPMPPREKMFFSLQKIMDLRKEMKDGTARIYLRYGDQNNTLMTLTVGEDFEIVDPNDPMALIDRNGLLVLARSYASFAEKYEIENYAQIKVCAKKNLCS